MINNINQFRPIQPLGDLFEQRDANAVPDVNAPTFLDVFRSIVGEAGETQSVKSQDMLDLMLGNVDDLERVQANITKAQIAMELLTTTRNTALEAYNEIIKMAI
jgi:flagellar hook-basal body complex protein FliE